MRERARLRVNVFARRNANVRRLRRQNVNAKNRSESAKTKNRKVESACAKKNCGRKLSVCGRKKSMRNKKLLVYSRLGSSGSRTISSVAR